MLKDSEIMAVLPAKDINRAKDFYRDKLGLEPSESPGGRQPDVPRRQRNELPRLPDRECRFSQEHPDGLGDGQLEREMEELRGRGVVFEEYDFPGLKTENGVATTDWGKAAWFLDSEGNIPRISPQRT